MLYSYGWEIIFLNLHCLLTHENKMDNHRHSSKSVAAAKLVFPKDMERKEATQKTGSSKKRVRLMRKIWNSIEASISSNVDEIIWTSAVSDSQLTSRRKVMNAFAFNPVMASFLRNIFLHYASKCGGRWKPRKKYSLVKWRRNSSLAAPEVTSLYLKPPFCSVICFL